MGQRKTVWPRSKHVKNGTPLRDALRTPILGGANATSRKKKGHLQGRNFKRVNAGERGVKLASGLLCTYEVSVRGRKRLDWGGVGGRQGLCDRSARVIGREGVTRLFGEDKLGT